MALALVLLVGSGLMIRTFQALRHVDPGFSIAQEVQTLRISIPETQVKEPERVMRMEEAILRKDRGAAGRFLGGDDDLGSDGRAASNDPIYAEDQPTARARFLRCAASSSFRRATCGRWAAALIAGRDFTWTETYNADAGGAGLGESGARDCGSDPRAALGKRIRATPKDDWREVIGVVADVRDDGVDQKAPTIVYWPLLRRILRATERACRAAWRS